MIHLRQLGRAGIGDFGNRCFGFAQGVPTFLDCLLRRGALDFLLLEPCLVIRNIPIWSRSRSGTRTTSLSSARTGSSRSTRPDH